MLTGLAGSLFPFLPGTSLIFLEALVYALVTNFHPVTPGKLVFLAGLETLARVVVYAATAS
jgi:uncharacterized protein YqgC (DUF456 family)